MKNFISIVFLLTIFAAVELFPQNTGKVSGGIFASANVLTIQCQPGSNYSGTSVDNIIFAIRWPTTEQYNGVALSEMTGSFGITQEGGAWVNAGYNYQQYSTASTTAITWTSGVQYTLGTITVTGGFATGTFEFAPAGTAINPATEGAGDWYFSIGGIDRTNYDQEFFQPNVSGVGLDVSLPVELTAFSAIAKERTVMLTWKTATEKDNAGFEVQRKRADAEWSNVGFVDGSGTSAVEHSYQLQDVVKAAGVHFYRLKQVDRDGRFIYSSEVEVTTTLSAQDYTLGLNYPNPFNPSTRFTFAVKNNEPIAVKVFNTLGQEVAVLFNGIAVANTIYEMNFNATGLASGTYFYLLRTNNRYEIKKMMLMK